MCGVHIGLAVSLLLLVVVVNCAALLLSCVHRYEAAMAGVKNFVLQYYGIADSCQL